MTSRLHRPGDDCHAELQLSQLRRTAAHDDAGALLDRSSDPEGSGHVRGGGARLDGVELDARLSLGVLHRQDGGGGLGFWSR